MTPLVSVIIPNYNHARFLDERIQSVLNQSYQNYEVIILDDKSTDNSVEVIERYKTHPKVSHIIYNKENSGSPFKQWHQGLELAKGDLIWIAESDDSCDKTLLERNVESFQKDEKCVLSFTCSIRMDENGVLHHKIQNMPKNVTIDGKVFNQRYMYCGCIVANASSALFKKHLAMAIDRVYMDYKGGGDRVFWMEIAECGEVSMICEPLNYYRKHSANSTKRLYEDGTDFFEAKKTYDFIKSRYHISRRDSLRILKFYLYRIKYVEHFYTEQIKKDLLEYWNPSLTVSCLVVLQRCKILVNSRLGKLKRIVTL